MLLRTITFFVFTALTLAFGVASAWAHDIKLMIDDRERTIWSVPYRPYLTLTSLAELREHYHEVKDVMPPMPFIMESTWVLPGSKDGFRTFPVDLEREEYFSPNGDYVAQIEQWKGFVDGRPHSKHFKLMSTEGSLLWETRDGPIGALITNEGFVIGRSQHNEPISLTYYERDGRIKTRVKNIFDIPHSGHLKLVPQERIILAWHPREVVALSYEGEILWKYTTPVKPVMALMGAPGLDPLGRGVYIPIRYRSGETSMLLFHAHTGAAQGFVWENKPIPIDGNYLSPSGKVLGIKTADKIGLMDWQSGEFFFWRDDLTGDELTRGRWDATSVADNPVLLAVDAAKIFIIDKKGKQVWACGIRTGSLLNLLNVNGRNMSVAMVSSYKNESIVFNGFLFYRIEVS